LLDGVCSTLNFVCSHLSDEALKKLKFINTQILSCVLALFFTHRNTITTYLKRNHDRCKLKRMRTKMKKANEEQRKTRMKKSCDLYALADKTAFFSS